ncbi:MAG: NTP transferase domain-containing protein [Kofleriaceae bacterium]
MKAVILAAGVGSRLAPLTNDRPKVLVEVLGRPILFRQLDYLAQAGIPSRDVIVVGGYRIDMLHRALSDAGYKCAVVLNEKYDTWGNFFSLQVVESYVRGQDFLQIDGDVILDENLFPRMIAAPGDGVIATDRQAELDGDAMKVQLRPDGIHVMGIDKRLDPAQCHGEYIGVTKLSAVGSRIVFRELASFPQHDLTHEYYDHAYHRLTSRGDLLFQIVDVRGCSVLEVDDLTDLKRAEAALAERSA